MIMTINATREPVFNPPGEFRGWNAGIITSCRAHALPIWYTGSSVLMYSDAAEVMWQGEW